MSREYIHNQKGFSLIEVLVAIVILAIGLLSLTTLQSTGIKGNARARHITIATDWGADRIEQIFALKYDDPDLVDDGKVDNSAPHTSDGAAGLNNTLATANPPDGSVTSPDGHYTIIWNIADNNIMNNTKTIRVIVVRTEEGQTRTVTMDYLKSKYM